MDGARLVLVGIQGGKVPFSHTEKASLAAKRASEAFSVCPMTRQENGSFPYIPSYRPFAIFAAISSGES